MPRPLTHKQRIALDFLYEFIETRGYAPTPAHVIEATGRADFSWTLRQLEVRRLVECQKSNTRTKDGHGRAIAVTRVCHPDHGEIAVDDFEASPFDPEVKERPCMCCALPFLSQHKFNRLCFQCSSNALSYQHANMEGGYISNGFAILTGGVGGTFLRRVRK